MFIKKNLIKCMVIVSKDPKHKVKIRKTPAGAKSKTLPKLWFLNEMPSKTRLCLWECSHRITKKRFVGNSIQILCSCKDLDSAPVWRAP